jgi:hypothetical protein
MADFLYNKLGQKLGNKEIDFDNDDLYMVLLTDSYNPLSSDEFYSDLTGELTTGSGYTAGGQLLTDVLWTELDGIATLTATNPAWSNATFTVRYGVIYDDTATGKPLICLYDFSVDRSPYNGTFTVHHNVDGILRVRVELIEE